MAEQTDKIYKQLPDRLLPWYDKNKRDLPWRHTKDPYAIWLSEIMLKQTRVEAVKDYYSRFLKALPTVSDLANADDGLLGKLWEGLGYYTRVRNLKKAAIEIVSDYNGAFPDSYESVLALPGIGPYTAGAICSIVYDLPTPAVDGNVLRVISRLTDDETPIDAPAYKKTVQEKLEIIYPRRAGDFTQALMELGATVCGPNQKPDCDNCPCVDICLAHKRGRELILPVKKPKKERREEELTVFILKCGEMYALQKRKNTGLLAKLWQFYNVPGVMDAQQALKTVAQLHPKDLLRQTDKKHIFTHIQWNMRGYYIEVAQQCDDFCWFTRKQIDEKIALPTAFRQFWEDNIF